MSKDEKPRGRWHPGGGWLCACRTCGHMPFTNLHPAWQRYCARCQIYRPKREAKSKALEDER